MEIQLNEENQQMIERIIKRVKKEEGVEASPDQVITAALEGLETLIEADVFGSFLKMAMIY